MLQNDIINQLLKELKAHGVIGRDTYNNPNRKNAIDELLQCGFLKRKGDINILTDLGKKAIKTELSYPECLSAIRNPPKIYIEQHIGHNITGNRNKLDFSTDNRIQTKESKTTLLEKLTWIGVIITSLITIYEFWIKKI